MKSDSDQFLVFLVWLREMSGIYIRTVDDQLGNAIKHINSNYFIYIHFLGKCFPFWYLSIVICWNGYFFLDIFP